MRDDTPDMTGPKTLTTPGGVPVVVERLPSLRSVAISVNFDVGSRDEDEERCGIAHLIEHIMFKGTKDRGAKEISDLIENAGGEMNGFTTKEMTSYHVFCLDDTIGTAQELLGEMVLDPLFDKEHLEVEKNVVTQEITMLEDEPEDYCRVLLDRSLWRGHPMSFSESGEVECVKGISQKQMRSFYDAAYTRDNVSIVACGNLKEKQVLEWAAETFDGMKTGKRKERVAPTPRSSIDLYPRDGDQAYVEMASPSHDAHHPERNAAGLCSAILGAGTSSRLYQRIREQDGLVYSIYMMPQTYTDCGVIEGGYNTSAENATKVARMIAEEIEDLKNEGLKPGELDRAKRWVKGMFVRKLENSEDRMYWLSEQYHLRHEVKGVDETMEQFMSVTEEQVLKAAEELLRPKRMCIALHMPEKAGRKTARELRALDF
jgi:predicted Zn-dependent peptidase